MTYAEARAEILTRLPEEKSFCIQVDCWDHRDGREVFEFSIWDGEEHHRGSTLEFALELFNAKHPPIVETPKDAIEQQEAESVFAATPAEVTAN